MTARAWDFKLDGETYDVVDHGAGFGVEVGRRGYAAVVGFFKRGRFVVHRAAVAPELVERIAARMEAMDPNRKGQAGIFGDFEAVKPAKAKPRAERADQTDLFAGSRGGFADLALFARKRA